MPVRYRIVEPSQSWTRANPVSRWGKVYASGNYVDGNPKVTADNWDGGVQFNLAPDEAPDGSVAKGAITDTTEIQGIIAKVRDKPFPMSPLAIQTAQQAYDSVLADAGRKHCRARFGGFAASSRKLKLESPGEWARKSPRNQWKVWPRINIGVAGNGIITDISQVGGYPEYKGEPATFTQNDGIPDWWKKKYGLDVNSNT